MSIPVLDLKEFFKNDPDDKKKFVQKTGSALEEIGFIAVENHGVSNAVITDLYRYVQQFFALSTEEKLKYEIVGLAGQRGYTSFGREHAKGSESPDLKEFFQYGQTVEDEDVIKAEYLNNVQVNEIQGFNTTLYNVYRSFEKSGAIILEAIALYLGLEQNYFRQYIHNGNSILRCIHYPPILQEPKTAIRAEQHEDINLITLLVGASAQGLEIQTKTKEWIAVTSLPDQIVVNVGDMLQRLTNNKLKSTTHRVVNPPREMWNTSRYSIPFFLHPRSDMSLASLSSCINKDNPKAYADVTAGEYLDERLKEIGLKK